MPLEKQTAPKPEHRPTKKTTVYEACERMATYQSEFTGRRVPCSPLPCLTFGQWWVDHCQEPMGDHESDGDRSARCCAALVDWLKMTSAERIDVWEGVQAGDPYRGGPIEDYRRYRGEKARGGARERFPKLAEELTNKLAMDPEKRQPESTYGDENWFVTRYDVEPLPPLRKEKTPST